MLQNEMMIQEVVKDCVGFRGVDGNDILHLCFDHRSESDLFTKIKFSQLFAQNFVFH